MNLIKGKRLIAIALNVILIVCVVASVIIAFNSAQKTSFAQNIENINTLTDASANKVEIEYRHHSEEISKVANYINNYNLTGMSEMELRSFFASFYTLSENTTWELVDGTSNGESGSQLGFETIPLLGLNSEPFVYKAQSYPELARIFASCGKESIGKLNYLSEFTDGAMGHDKVSAITTTVALKKGTGYEYKTIMLLIKSSYITDLLAYNNQSEVMKYYDYSNIIIDNHGDYVISNSQFQGTNFMEYISLYNDNFNSDETDSISNNLKQDNYQDVLYYKNNREQNCAYTIVPIQNSEWHVLSIVPLDSFHNSYDFSQYFIMFAIFFTLLFILDIVFILNINIQLRHKTKEAQEANMAKTSFLSSMSHDIRTPMNAIIGMTIIADDTLTEENPDVDTLKDCIKTIQLSGNHLLTLINDILDISKIENGKVNLVREDFSISESITKMLDIMQPQIEEKNLSFEPHIINVNHEFVHADELRINQVYINILSNAIKYTNRGGKITLDFSEEKIEGQTDVARYIYRVSDTGIGMDQEFLETIFDSFSRAIDTRVNETQGTGLGMCICKQLVDLMGGTITVESELNVGSTFTVTLDLPCVSRKSEQVSLEGLSVLLIDDDKILLETAELLLKNANIEAMTSSDGKMGIQLAKDYQKQNKGFDVVLVDWKMAGMDGFHVVEALRKELGGNIKIIVMTAYNIADIEREARLCGADGFIMKPLFKSNLLQAIHLQFSDAKEKAALKVKENFDLSILVAEDNNINWKVLEKLLSRYGVHADRVENGQEAINVISSNASHYDLVLMDVQMPIMNGYDAARAIRKLPDQKLASIPIYAMTADTFAEDVAKCLESGMNGHLAKPIELERLIKVLSSIQANK